MFKVIQNEVRLAGIKQAPFEDWYRHRYFNNQIDISDSGVEEPSFSDIKKKTDLDFKDLDDMYVLEYGKTYK